MVRQNLCFAPAAHPSAFFRFSGREEWVITQYTTHSSQVWQQPQDVNMNITTTTIHLGTERRTLYSASSKCPCIRLSFAQHFERHFIHYFEILIKNSLHTHGWFTIQHSSQEKSKIYFFQTFPQLTPGRSSLKMGFQKHKQVSVYFTPEVKRGKTQLVRIRDTNNIILFTIEMDLDKGVSTPSHSICNLSTFIMIVLEIFL